MVNVKNIIRLFLLIFVFHHSNALEEIVYTVTGSFREEPPELGASLQLNCKKDGDKIKISDIKYQTTGCRESESRPQDPAADSNSISIYQCTGKRTCVVPRDHIKRPFLPRKPMECDTPTRYLIIVLYACVPQESIRSMCTSFTTQEFRGYLSTPSYPMLLKPGEVVAPCRCHLEGTPNSRITFTVLESNLGLQRYGRIHNSVGNNSGSDMNACQSEVNKQYLEIKSNHGKSNIYMLCSHKYNFKLPSSATTYDLLFESPISRVAGSLWIQYFAEEPNSMVKVSCSEPIVTTIAPVHYTDLYRERGNGGVRLYTDGKSYRLILGLVAAALFLLILISIVVITVKYNRKISHYMMHKYSKKKKDKERKDPTLSEAEGPVTNTTKVYQETHFDSVDETTSCGKPTAHIPPQLSVSEKLNKATQEDPKAKLLNGKAKYSTFKSTYISKPRCDSDSDGVSESSDSKHSGERSHHTPTSETSSAPSVRRVAPPSVKRQTDSEDGRCSVNDQEGGAPIFEDIWVRVNTPDGTPSRSKSLPLHQKSVDDEIDSDRLLMSIPPSSVSFSPMAARRQAPTASVPLMQRSADSRTNSDDEEMDIKFVNPNMVTPYKSPVHIVKPALKSSVSRSPSSRSAGRVRRDSVKFSDQIHQSSDSLEYGTCETDLQKRQRLKAAILQYPPALAPKPKQYHHNSQTSSPVYNQPRLVVDLTQRKSKSLPSSTRRLTSTSSLKGYAHTAKRSKRKCASDNDKASSSSQEQLYQSPIPPPPPVRTRNRRGSSLPAASKHIGENGKLPIGMNRRTRIPENDDELISKIDNDLDTLMRGNLT